MYRNLVRPLLFRLNAALAHAVAGLAPRLLGGSGISGAPLKQRSLEIVHRLYRRTAGALPLISVGGIETGRDARGRIQAGATLVEVYTGFVYRGPLLAYRLGHELAAIARARI
jgi:dihydroorotate dehydrogenase